MRKFDEFLQDSLSIFFNTDVAAGSIPVYDERIKALKEFKKDILNANFPSKKETPDIEPDELEIFMTLLDKK